MGQKGILRRIAKSLVNLDAIGLKRGVETALGDGLTPYEIIKGGFERGMEEVGARYERGEYYLSELIMACETMNEAMETLKPSLKPDVGGARGRVLIGAVQGDLHDIGKNLVASMLRSAGFEVHDLGVDVSPNTFVAKTKALKPDIVGMSTLLSVTMPRVEETIEALRRSGLGDDVRVLVGGRCLNEEIAKEMGADAYGEDAWDGVRKAKKLLSTKT